MSRLETHSLVCSSCIYPTFCFAFFTLSVPISFGFDWVGFIYYLLAMTAHIFGIGGCFGGQSREGAGGTGLDGSGISFGIGVGL